MLKIYIYRLYLRLVAGCVLVNIGIWNARLSIHRGISQISVLSNARRGVGAKRRGSVNPGEFLLKFR